MATTLNTAASVLLFCMGFASAVVNLQQDGSTCTLKTFIPFTDLRDGSPPQLQKNGDEYGYGQWSSPQALGKASFSLMATAMMAKDHFNKRNSSVVPDLKKYEFCNITFPDDEGWILDSSYKRSNVVDQLLDIMISGGGSGSNGEHENDNTGSINQTMQQQEQICAIIGPVDLLAVEGASILAENLQIPLLTYEPIAGERTAGSGRQTNSFPNTISSLAATSDFAATIAEFIQRDIWSRDYIGLIYQSGYGEGFQDAMNSAEGTLIGLRPTIRNSFQINKKDSIHAALEQIQKEGYHTIVVAANHPSSLNVIAEVADELGLLGDDNVWILTGDILPPELMGTTIRFKLDSPADKLLRGAALVTNYDPFLYEPKRDKFLSAWKSLGDEMLTRLQKVHPLDPLNHPESYYIGEPGYFQEQIPTEFASFLYDAIINAGMSACRSLERGMDHLKEILEGDFQGASGRTVFKEQENARNVTGVQFGMYNIRPGSTDELTNTRGYTRHLVAIYSGTETKWTKVEDAEFLFFDGTANEPQPDVRSDAEYLSRASQITGLVLIGLSLFVFTSATVWIFVRRKERVVAASQPQFLYLLCFGATLQAISVIFVSFDESDGWTEEQLGRACVADQWFFAIGYLVQFCAIFSKLWRLSKVLALRRRVVNFHQVLLPFVIMIGSTVIVLLVWQMVDPLQWEADEDISQTDNAKFSQYGNCTSSESGLLPFFIPLLILFGVIMAMAISILWRVRDAQAEFTDGKALAIGIILHLQIWAIGAPVYLIAAEVSQNFAYMAQVLLVLGFANVFVVAVIVPKMVMDLCGKRRHDPPEGRIGSGVIHVSGLAPSSLATQSPRVSHNDAFYEDRMRAILEAEEESFKSALGSGQAEREDPNERTPVLDADCTVASPTRPRGEQAEDEASDRAGNEAKEDSSFRDP